MRRALLTALVARAELKAFWSSPAGGLALAVFLVLGGLWFYNSVAVYAVDSLRAMARGGVSDANLGVFSSGLANLGLLAALVAPLTTMRSMAASADGGHFDLWLSWPVGRLELALGLHLAAVGSLAVMIVLGLAPFAGLMLLGVGSLKLLAVAFFGLILASAAFAAVGLAAAAMARTPLASALAALGALGFLWAMGWAAPYLPPGASGLIQGLAFEPRLTRFAIGLVDLGDVLYFLVLALGGVLAARPSRG